MDTMIDPVLFGLLRTAGVKSVVSLPTASARLKGTIFHRSTDNTFWNVAAGGLTWESAAAKARAAAPVLIDPLAVGGASYDTTDGYAYLAFPAAGTEAFRLLTIRDPSSMTVCLTNASGAETGDARIEVSIDGGSTWTGQDVTFTAGGSASATFDLSSASGAVEVLIRRDHDYANDDLAAEIELTDGSIY